MANNSQLVTHFKNPLLRKVSYFLFLMGFFFIPVLFTAFPEELGMVIFSAVIVFGTSIYFQWDGFNKIVYIRKNSKFAIGKLFGGYSSFNFNETASLLAICETQRYLTGLAEYRTFYHIVLKVNREDLIYFQGYKQSMCIPSTAKSYYITLLIFNSQETAIKILSDLGSKGLPITTGVVSSKENNLLYTNF